MHWLAGRGELFVQRADVNWARAIDFDFDDFYRSAHASSTSDPRKFAPGPRLEGGTDILVALRNCDCGFDQYGFVEGTARQDCAGSQRGPGDSTGGVQWQRRLGWCAGGDACRKQSSHRDSRIWNGLKFGHRFVAGEVVRRKV